MSDEQERRVTEIQTNDNLPLLFVDNLNINSRGDGFHVLRFISHLPDGFKEQARMVVPKQALQNMLDALCSHTDYFPAKPKNGRRKINKSS